MPPHPSNVYNNPGRVLLRPWPRRHGGGGGGGGWRRWRLGAGGHRTRRVHGRAGVPERRQHVRQVQVQGVRHFGAATQTDTADTAAGMGQGRRCCPSLPEPEPEPTGGQRCPALAHSPSPSPSPGAPRCTACASAPPPRRRPTSIRPPRHGPSPPPPKCRDRAGVQPPIGTMYRPDLCQHPRLACPVGVGTSQSLSYVLLGGEAETRCDPDGHEVPVPRPCY